MQKVVGVRRFHDSELYYFTYNDEELRLGDKLVVQFDDFQTVVEVCKLGNKFQDERARELKPLLRKATESDLKKYESFREKTKSFLPKFKKKSLELGLMMKFISAEYSLDGSKILIVFSSEERVDFRQLLKELASMLKTRIELKQIGQRDEVKNFGGVGPCGQPCCCSRFLKNFDHVTVKMAKNQGLSLSPTKINGICGRLMCCLGYESEMYEQILSKMPKVGSEISTPNGKGIVVFNDILREKVSIKRQADGDNFVVEEFTLEEINQNFEKKQTENAPKTLKNDVKSEQKVPKNDPKSAENDVKSDQKVPKNDQKSVENDQKSDQKVTKNDPKSVENDQKSAENDQKSAENDQKSDPKREDFNENADQKSIINQKSNEANQNVFKISDLNTRNESKKSDNESKKLDSESKKSDNESKKLDSESKKLDNGQSQSNSKNYKNNFKKNRHNKKIKRVKK